MLGHPREDVPPTTRTSGRCLHRHCASWLFPTPTTQDAADLLHARVGRDPTIAQRSAGPNPRPLRLEDHAGQRNRNCDPLATHLDVLALGRRRDHLRSVAQPKQQGRPSFHWMHRPTIGVRARRASAVEQAPCCRRANAAEQDLEVPRAGL